MKIYIVIACTLLCLVSCSPYRPTVVNITPVHTITPPAPSTEEYKQTEEQRIEEQLVAPLPTMKFEEGTPVRLPLGCSEGQTRGVDC